MFVLREIAGWILLVLGLITFGITYLFLLREGRIFESGPMTFIGFLIFRGGLHLLKVATAAKICQEPSQANS
jgi:hypothetical protein